jgi:hypothetical protein
MLNILNILELTLNNNRINQLSIIISLVLKLKKLKTPAKINF